MKRQEISAEAAVAARSAAVAARSAAVVADELLVAAARRGPVVVVAEGIPVAVVEAIAGEWTWRLQNFT